MKNERYNLIIILGPTASGKTRIAARLARDIASEVISADSRQVYKGMDLGTGKDVEEFLVDGVDVHCHLIDIVDTDHEFNVFEYQREFYRCFSDISERGMTPVLAGGTGLYLESVIRDYRMPAVPEDPVLREKLCRMDLDAMRERLCTIKPELHNTTDTLDRDRLVRAIEIAEYAKTHEFAGESEHTVIKPFIVGIRWERSKLREKITTRLRKRIDAGMIEEVQGLHDKGISWERLDAFGLEYRYISRYLRGKIDFDEMFEQLNTRIHQFSKRQMTWFRRMERKGIVIHWVNNDDYGAVKRLIEEQVR